MAATAGKKSNTLMIVLIVLGIGVLLIVAVIGILVSMGVFGARRYISEAKQAEGRAQVRALALGIVSCAGYEGDGGQLQGLPATAKPVPATLAEVSGKKYQSSPAEWKDPAYDCAHFSMSYPQYFQYQWVRTSADQGKAVAIADLDGNGSADATFEAPVTCTSGNCSAGALVEK